MLLEDGYHEVPPGRLAAVVTYLEMTAPPPGLDLEHSHERDGVERVLQADLDTYRALFRRVGAPWLWFSRLHMSDAELRSILEDPCVELYTYREAGDEIGLLELDGRVPGEIELAFLGVAPEYVGHGAGGRLMRFALRRVWSQSPRRLRVHTCSLDHPGALAYYMRFGFHPYRRAVEVAPDPRLTGHLPAQTAPGVPLL
jgi:GNAT superfamily N-acetyltransferase